MIVRTAAGQVRGTDSDRGHAWLGIPFAEPPVGPLRFQSPRPTVAWRGVRDAYSYGPPATQIAEPGVGGEDCLYLNVWSPGVERSLPVLVWVHGGAFFMGSGSDHDGAALAARGDLVVVTVNYRLGPWGFIHLAGFDGFDDGANRALQDLRLALSWVRRNIAGFGGDPGAVTVAGHSAGAMLLGTLLGVPRAAGLFQRAILLSGAADLVHTSTQAAEVTRRLLDALGLSAASASRLNDVSADELRAAGETVRLGAGDALLGNHAYLPVVDGEVLTRHPLAAVAAGASRDVAMVIGWCRDEMAGFAAEGNDLLRAQESYHRRVLGDASWERVAATYRNDARRNEDPRTAMLGDALFGVPAIRLAEAHSGTAGRTWAVRFDHAPAVSPYDQVGPAHGADLACLWSDPPLDPVASHLQDLVAATARHGDPANPMLPNWPPYRLPERTTLVLDTDPAVRPDIDGERRAAWAGTPYGTSNSAVNRMSSTLRPTSTT